jgi:hypothetical protein
MEITELGIRMGLRPRAIAQRRQRAAVREGAAVTACLSACLVWSAWSRTRNSGAVSGVMRKRAGVSTGLENFGNSGGPLARLKSRDVKFLARPPVACDARWTAAVAGVLPVVTWGRSPPARTVGYKN